MKSNTELLLDEVPSEYRSEKAREPERSSRPGSRTPIAPGCKRDTGNLHLTQYSCLLQKCVFRMPPSNPRSGRQAGVTIAELLVVVALAGLMATMAIWQSDTVSGGLKVGTDELVSITKTARTYAMSTTTPHRLVPITDTLIAIEYGGPCGDAGATWPPLEDERYDLPEGTRLSSTSWDVCFTTRGWTTDVHDLRLFEGESYQDISVLLGGSVRVGPVHRDP